MFCSLKYIEGWLFKKGQKRTIGLTVDEGRASKVIIGLMGKQVKTRKCNGARTPSQRGGENIFPKHDIVCISSSVTTPLGDACRRVVCSCKPTGNWEHSGGNKAKATLRLQRLINTYRESLAPAKPLEISLSRQLGRSRRQVHSHFWKLLSPPD